MGQITTIQVEKRVLTELKEAREYPDQTYNDLIGSMIKIFKISKERNQYDKFLHEIQKQKMKELWNNKEDEAWQNV